MGKQLCYTYARHVSQIYHTCGFLLSLLFCCVFCCIVFCCIAFCCAVGCCNLKRFILALASILMSVSTILLSSNEIIMIKMHLDCFVIWLVIVVGTFHWAKGSTWTGNPALDHLKHNSQNCWFLLLNLMRLSFDAFIDQHHWDDNRHHHEIFLSSHESSETSVSALAALAVASIMGQHHHTNTTDIKEGENIKMAI